MTTYPSDWKVVPLGEVAAITTGHRDVNEGCEHGYYPFFTCAKKVYSAETYSFDGEAITVAGNGDVGNLHYVNGKFEAYQRTYVLMNFKEDIRYILQFLDARLMPILSEGKFGSSMPYIVLGQLAGVTIPLPPLPEQKRIAGVLGDMDKLIENLGKRIEKKRQIKKGAMQELLTGKKRLSGFTGEWKQVKLGEVASLQNGYAFKSETYNNDGAYTVITIANVQDGCFDCKEANRIAILPDDIQEHQRLKIGDVLVSMTGNVGRVCRVNSPNCLLNQRVGRFDVRGINIEYFYAVLRGSGFLLAMIEKGQGGAQPNIGKGDIEGYEIPLPPTLAEQRAIAAVLSDMDAEIANLERRQEKLKQVKKGMLQDLLTGKVRLKGQGGAT